MANRPVDQDPKSVGKSQREYEHSSGDRNTKRSEKDWKGFSGGSQRDADPPPEGTSPTKGTDRR